MLAPLGVCGIPSIFQLAGLAFLPESPRWLVNKGRREEVATSTLASWRASEACLTQAVLTCMAKEDQNQSPLVVLLYNERLLAYASLVKRAKGVGPTLPWTRSDPTSVDPSILQLTIGARMPDTRRGRLYKRFANHKLRQKSRLSWRSSSGTEAQR